MAGLRRSFAMIGGRVMRLTKVDGCGNPIYGSASRIVTEGFISIAATANTTDTDAVEVTNANGKLCASRPAKSKLSGYTVELSLCGVDPDVISFMTGNPTTLNGAGDVAGFDVDTDVDPSILGVALEVWSDIGQGDACAPGVSTQYGYACLPFLSGGTLGDFTVENDAVNFTVGNATSKKGHSWGTGPYLIDNNAAGNGIALAPIKPSSALRVLEVTRTPPQESGGAIPLDNPASPPATSAAAGTPGAFTPTVSFRPETLADMTGVTASPTTAWTATQYVTTQSGQRVKWNGTAWVVFTG